MTTPRPAPTKDRTRPSRTAPPTAPSTGSGTGKAKSDAEPAPVASSASTGDPPEESAPGGAQAAAPPLALRVSGATRVGRRRSENQDTFLVTALDRGVLVLVCDGVGGPPRGGVAAHLAASAVSLAVEERWSGRTTGDDGGDVDACLGKAVEAANRLVHERARLRPSLEGMGTTITAAAFVGRSVHLSQVGDSRAYLVRRGRARQLTRDQTVAQEMLDLGLLSPDEAARSPYRNVLAQSVGAEPEVEPVGGRYELESDDVVVLCSDGLSGVVGAAELAHFVQDTPTPATACRRLVELAAERGAKDDVTVVIVRAHEDR